MINEIKNKIHALVQKYEQGKEVYRTLRFSMKLRCETSSLILCSRFLVTTLISRQLSVNISTPIMKMPQRNSWSILVRTLYIQVTSMRYRVGLKQTSITNWLKNSFCSRSTIGVWCSERRFCVIIQQSRWRNLVMWFSSFVSARIETLKHTKVSCRLQITTAIRN